MRTMEVAMSAMEVARFATSVSAGPKKVRKLVD